MLDHHGYQPSETYYRKGKRCPANGGNTANWYYSIHTDKPVILWFGDPLPGLPDGNGAWILSENVSANGAYQYVWLPDATPSTSTTHSLPRNPHKQTLPTLEVASIEVRDRVYRTLLDLCPLTTSHKKNVGQRGFSRSNLEQIGLSVSTPQGEPYQLLGSLPLWSERRSLARQIQERTGLSTSQLLRVPGFNKSDQGNLTFVKSRKIKSGILVPCYDTRGRIQGLQVRNDKVKPGDSRYKWISSWKPGPSSGAPVGVLQGDASEVWVTEGFFKGLALRLAQPHSVLYMPTAGAVPQVVEQVQILKPSVVHVVLDSDWMSNPSVYGHLGRHVKELEKVGVETKVWTWPNSKGKGIDDALLKGGMSLTDLTLVPIDGIKRGTAYKPRHNGKKPKGLLSPNITVSDLPTWKPNNVKPVTLEVLREEAERHVQAALSAPLGTLSVLTNPTGSGKSTAARKQIKPGTVLVFSSYPDLEEKQATLLKMGYNVKAFYGRTEEPKDGEYDKQDRWEQAGCNNLKKANIWAGKGHSACTECKLKVGPQDIPRCGYMRQVREVKANPSDFLLMLLPTFVQSGSMQSLLCSEESPYHTIVLDDVTDPWLSFANTLELKHSDLQQWKKHCDIPKEVRDTLEGLVKELQESIKRQDHSRLTTEQTREKATHLLTWLEKQSNTNIFPWEKREANNKNEDLEKELPVALGRSLCEALRDSKPIQVRPGQKDSLGTLRWLQPNSTLLQALPRKRVVAMDATADLDLWKWFADLAGMQYSAPQPTRKTPKMKQVVDLLWNREQIEERSEIVQALIERVKDNGAVVTFKAKDKEDLEQVEERSEIVQALMEQLDESQTSHWGSGAGRGCNRWGGYEHILLAGHYSRKIQDVEDEAWIIESLASLFGKTPPVVSPSETRRFADPWRPWERAYEGKASRDLAEHLRRHKHTSDAVQYAARIAREEHIEPDVWLLNGEPLDGLPFEIEVEVWTVEELRKELGLPPLISKRGNNFLKYNQKRKEQSKQEALPVVLQVLCEYRAKHGRIPSRRELSRIASCSGVEKCSERLAARAIAIFRGDERTGSHKSFNIYIPLSDPPPTTPPSEELESLEAQEIPAIRTPSNSLAEPGEGKEEPVPCYHGTSAPAPESYPNNPWNETNPAPLSLEVEEQVESWFMEWIEEQGEYPTSYDALEQFGFMLQHETVASTIIMKLSATIDLPGFPCVWTSPTFPWDWDAFLCMEEVGSKSTARAQQEGQRCRVLARCDLRKTILVEFEDGEQVVTASEHVRWIGC